MPVAANAAGGGSHATTTTSSGSEKYDLEVQVTAPSVLHVGAKPQRISYKVNVFNNGPGHGPQIGGDNELQTAAVIRPDHGLAVDFAASSSFGGRSRTGMSFAR